MAGLTVAETASNVVLFGGAWKDLLEKCSAYGNDPGPDTRTDLVTSAQGFVSAVSALANTPGYTALSQVTGFAAAVANINKDIASYQSAKTDDERIQDAATVLQDCTSIGGAVATFVGGVASDLGADGLVEIMESLGARFTVLGAIATLVPLGQSVGTWYNNTYLPQLKKFLGDSSTQQDEDMLLNMDSSGTTGEIIMAGQAGDTLSGSALQYTETGTQPGSAQLAENGTSDAEYDNGDDVLTDISGFQVTLNAASGIQIDGDNNLITATTGVSSATIDGDSNAITALAAATGSSFTLNGPATSANTVNLQGVTGISIHLGDSAATASATDIAKDSTAAGLTINSTGNSAVSIDSTTAGATVTANSSGNLSLTASNMTLDLAAGQYQLGGSGDTANLDAGSSVAFNGYEGVTRDTITGVSLTVAEFNDTPGVYSITSNTGVGLGYFATGYAVTTSVGSDGSMTLSISSSGVLQSSSSKFSASGDLSVSDYYSDGTSQTTTYDSSGHETSYDTYYSNGQTHGAETFDKNGIESSQADYFADGQISSYEIVTASGNEQATFVDGAAYADQVLFKTSTGTPLLVGYDGATGDVTSAWFNAQGGGDGFVNASIEVAQPGDKYFESVELFNSAGSEVGSASYNGATGAVTSNPSENGTAPETSPLVPYAPIASVLYNQSLPTLPALSTFPLPAGGAMPDAYAVSPQMQRLIQSMATYDQMDSAAAISFSAVQQEHHFTH